MTLNQLRALINSYSHYPGDTPVIIQKDGEGNDFSPLADVDVAMYTDDDGYEGSTYPTAEEIAASGSGYTEEDAAPPDAVRVLVLSPVH